MNKTAILVIARKKFAGLDERYEGEHIIHDDVAVQDAVKNSFRVLHLALEKPVILLEESGDYALFSRLLDGGGIDFSITNGKEGDAAEAYSCNWLENVLDKWEGVKQTGRLFPPEPEDPEAED